LIQAFVPSAGRGDRLKPLSACRPKALVPVAGMPLLVHILNQLAAYNVQRVVVNRHHLSERFDSLLCRDHLNVDLCYSQEERLLDSGGGLAQAMRRYDLGNNFFYHNGDILLISDLRKLWEHHENGGHLATLLVDPFRGNRNVAMAQDGQILGFRRSIPGGRDVAWLGVAILSRSLRTFFPPRETFSILEVFEEAIRNRGKVMGYILDPRDFWEDLGTFERYIEVHRILAKGLFSLPGHAQVRQVKPGVWTAKTACVPKTTDVRGYAVVGAGTILEPRVSLENTILWEDCRVLQGIRLKGCIVLDKTQIRENHENEILSPDGNTALSFGSYSLPRSNNP